MGRLIDADRLREQYCKDNCGDRQCVDAMDRCVFIDAVLDAPTVEAIPKDQYEQRLKADLVAMLTEIQLEIEEKHKEEDFMNDWSSGYNIGVIDISDLIQQKINELNGE